MSSLYVAFAVSIAVLISSPGPVISLVVSESRKERPVKTIVGALVSAQLLLILALLIINFAIDISPVLIDAGQIIGGLYLLWVGICSLLRQSDFNIISASIGENSFWRAFKIGVSNPKDILFLMAFLPAFISADDSMVRQSIFLLLIWLLIDCIVLLTYSHLSQKIFRYKIGNILLTYAPSITILILGVFSLSYGVSSIMGLNA